MLCQFTFKNFKSFKEEAFLDFYAEPISDNIDSVISGEDDEKFLPIIAIYGPNGGGKSTVLEALEYLKNIVVTPLIALKINEDMAAEERNILSKALKETNQEKYHKFDKRCKDNPITFEIMFRTQGIEYQYELAVLKNEIVKENLYYKIIGDKHVVIVFERTEEDCLIGEDIEFVSVEKLKNSLPLISHISASYDVELVDNALKWFLKINFMDYNNPISDRRVLIPKSDMERKFYFEMLKRMDINISDIRIEEDNDGKVNEIFTQHIINGEEFELPLKEESSGTRKIFSCLANINDCLQEGKVLVADELDAKLHPKLLRFIIELFTNPQSNKKGAQLLITSHDINNMNPEVFRRDEIWFCALNPNNASKLYALISFKKEKGKTPRKDEIYGKQYLEGNYGADPYIRKGLNWGMEL